MKKYLVPIISVLVIIVLFVGGLLAFNGMYNKVNSRIIKEAFPDMTSYELVSGKDYEFQELIIDEKVYAKVYATYKVFKDGKEVGFVYYVSSKGYISEIKVALGFNTNSKKITGIKVIDQGETPERYALLKDSFFKQFKNKSFSERLFTINKVSDATFTSVGFENAMIAARLQFSHDKNWAIPEPVFITESYQKLDDLTLVYKLEFNGETHVVTFDQTYKIVSSDKEIDAATKELFESFAKSNPLTDLVKSAETTDNLTVMVITARGFGGSIKGTITYDATLDKFTSFVIDPADHAESDDYGKAVIEGTYSTEFGPYTDELVNNPNVNHVSGATVTSNALKSMMTLAQKYVDEVINNE